MPFIKSGRIKQSSGQYQSLSAIRVIKQSENFSDSWGVHDSVLRGDDSKQNQSLSAIRVIKQSENFSDSWGVHDSVLRGDDSKTVTGF